MRVFLDANVLFSASNAGSNIARLIDWLNERGTAVSSPLAVEEARRNLELKRPQWLAEFERVRAHLDLVPATRFTLPVPLDAKDVPLLCAAIAAKCGYFVTGDKRDFGHLDGQAVLGVQVISPLRLAQLLAAKRSPS
jgi:predicted nucleic acid-binding protein